MALIKDNESTRNFLSLGIAAFPASIVAAVILSSDAFTKTSGNEWMIVMACMVAGMVLLLLMNFLSKQRFIVLKVLGLPAWGFIFLLIISLQVVVFIYEK